MIFKHQFCLCCVGTGYLPQSGWYFIMFSSISDSFPLQYYCITNKRKRSTHNKVYYTFGYSK